MIFNFKKKTVSVTKIAPAATTNTNKEQSANDTVFCQSCFQKSHCKLKSKKRPLVQKLLIINNVERLREHTAMPHTHVKSLRRFHYSRL